MNYRKSIASVLLFALVGCGFSGGPSITIPRAPSTALYVTYSSGAAVPAPGVQAFTIDQKTGVPTPAGTLIADPKMVILFLGVFNGSFFYAPDIVADILWAFPVNASTHALGVASTAATLPAGAAPVQPLLSPDGSHLFVACVANTSDDSLRSYSLSGGKATAVNSVSVRGIGYSAVIHPTNYFIYAPMTNATTSAIAVLSADYQTGALTRQSSLDVPFNTANPTFLALHPNGLLLYASGDTLLYKVNPTTGALTAQSQPPIANGDDVLLIDPSGKWLYSADSSVPAAQVVHGYSINSTTGVLTEMPTSPYPISATGTIQTMSIDGTSRFLYVSDNTLDLIYTWAIDSTTGALTMAGPHRKWWCEWFYSRGNNQLRNLIYFP